MLGRRVSGSCVLTDWLDERAPELMAHMEIPRSHWLKTRSNNMLEQVNEELRRRVRVLRISPNRASVCVWSRRWSSSRTRIG